MEWGNLRNWLSGDHRHQELRDTRALWDRTEALWRASPLGTTPFNDLVRQVVLPVRDRAEREPAGDIVVELCMATHGLLISENIIPLEADWPAIESDAAVAVEFREMLSRRGRWAAEFDRHFEIVRRELGDAYDHLIQALPESCFEDDVDEEALFEAPLVEVLDQAPVIISRLIWAAYDPDSRRLGMFHRLRETFAHNLLIASGFSPDADIVAIQHKLVYPAAYKDQTPSVLVETYLAGTPFAPLLEFPVPFHVPTEARFEHTHVIGGTGHGKTQLLQRMIHSDLVAAQREKRSVVVIDSQGDLINKLSRLAIFDPDDPDGLADRLVLIDPADVEFPAALNLFDAHLDRLRGYRPVDRERVLNGVIELYEVFFGAMLGAELTQKQGVIFRYLARLMLTIPGATIHTLMQLMEDGRPFKPQMAELEGSARYFFETEFFHPSFAATKKQILKRLWGVLSTPAFERMFAQRENKLDLFEAMNEGKIILVSTAKDLLKQDGSALFGRFFIAMLAQAALERSTIPAEDRTPTFVYVDEAQEYFDDSIETILSQARKYRVGLTLAHQTLDQLTPRLRAAFHANTSLKCVGGVSAKDARALADELHTSSDFIETMRRRKDRTEFAVWLKQRTPHALRMTVPLGHVERQPILTEEAYEALLTANRERYCGTLDDVLGFSLPKVAIPADRTAEPAVSEAIAPIASEAPPIVAVPVEPGPKAATPPRELGKGGSQHRYVQHLVKGLAEERGFRAIIEEPVEGGQIDVALHRDGLSVACEISITSTAPYEAKNLAKCVQGGFTRVFAIAADEKRLKAIRAAASTRLSEDELACVMFLTPMMVGDALDALAPPSEETSVVRGYRVKVSRTVIGAEEAGDRRAAVARVIAQSLRGLPPGD